MLVPAAVNTARLSRSSPAHYIHWEPASWTVANAGFPFSWINPFDSSVRLVDVIIYQRAAGTGGTSWSFDVQNSAGTSLMSAVGVATLASGANVKTDARGALTLPSGWTRPVIKTDGTQVIAKGGWITIATNETGTYSPHPTVNAVLVFEPLQ